MTWTQWLTAERRMLGFIALAIVVIGSSCGNVLLKLGAEPNVTRLFGLFAWKTLAGIGCFGLGLLAYAWALKQFDLHTAQIVVSLQYVSVILLSRFFLGEHIAVNEWIGIALIAAGLFVCSR